MRNFKLVYRLNLILLLFSTGISFSVWAAPSACSWSADSTLFGGWVSQISFAPSNANIVYVVGNRGVYRSDDGGLSWRATQIAPGLTTAIAIHPNDPNTLVVTIRDWPANAFNGLLYSVDGGVSWEVNIMDGMPNISGIWYAPSDPSIMYMTISDNGVMRSSDDGRNWQATALVDPVGVSCAVDKENAEVVACIGAQGVGNPSVYSTIDGGANWTETG
jgi:photosystem II stability/assembly factor-like uncharacterized protein